MKNNLQEEIEWLRSCFKGYEVDEEGLEKIANVIINLKTINLKETFPDKIYGYTFYELRQIINYAKQHNFKPK